MTADDTEGALPEQAQDLLPQPASAPADGAGPTTRPGRAPPEAERQCLVREENERTERTNVALPPRGERARFRCECGDPACRAVVAVTHLEYEAVRASGSHFLIRVNHENPESACVLRESETFAVVDVIRADARYAVLARNPRHAWVAARGMGGGESAVAGI